MASTAFSRPPAARMVFKTATTDKGEGPNAELREYLTSNLEARMFRNQVSFDGGGIPKPNA